MTLDATGSTDLPFRAACPTDAAALAAIYAPYVRNTHITFETVAVTAGEMAERVTAIAAAGLPWLVAEHQGKVVGYAHASPWKGRCAYRHSAETTIYLDRAARGRGLGTALYRALLADLATRDLHTLIAGIALPNAASIALHERLGFRSAGCFRAVGRKFDRWIDVGYWQLALAQGAAADPATVVHDEHGVLIAPVSGAATAEFAPLFDSYRQFYGAASDVPGAERFLAERTGALQSTLMGARMAGQPCGFVHLYPLWSSVRMGPVLVLNDLFVHPARRRCGVAKALVRAAEAHARQVGVRRLVLETQAHNADAIALYRGLGWIPDSDVLTFVRQL